MMLALLGLGAALLNNNAAENQRAAAEANAQTAQLAADEQARQQAAAAAAAEAAREVHVESVETKDCGPHCVRVSCRLTNISNHRGVGVAATSVPEASGPLWMVDLDPNESVRLEPATFRGVDPHTALGSCTALSLGSDYGWRGKTLKIDASQLDPSAVAQLGALMPGYLPFDYGYGAEGDE